MSVRRGEAWEDVDVAAPRLDRIMAVLAKFPWGVRVGELRLMVRPVRRSPDREPTALPTAGPPVRQRGGAAPGRRTAGGWPVPPPRARAAAEPVTCCDLISAGLGCQ